MSRDLAYEGPHRHCPAYPHHLHDLDNVVGERLPPIVRLLAEEDHHLTLQTLGHIQLIAGPGDGADPGGIELDYRSSHLEVEMIIGVDDCEELGIELVEELGDGLAR